MKRFSLIITLLTLVCCIAAQAQGTLRGYTSTQTPVNGNGPGSLNAFMKGMSQQSTVKAVDEDSVPFIPKEKVYVAPVPPTKPNTIKDDRKIIVTKDAWVENLVVKRVKKRVPDASIVPSNSKAISFSKTEKSGLSVSRSQFSPVPRAMQ